MDNKLQLYFDNFHHFKKNVVYDFKCFGGIGDYIKFFVFLLNICIENNFKLYYKINNISIENYINLKFKQMLITHEQMKLQNKINTYDDLFKMNEHEYYIVTPLLFHKSFKYNELKFNIEDIFDFSQHVILNKNKLLPDIFNYTSLHLRLGDKYLETKNTFIHCINDERKFCEENIINFINKNHDKNIIFFCDNNSFKLKLKETCKNIIILHSDIGHTALINTTEKQILDSITEFYIMINSTQIVAASFSGFSIIASKFKNIPYIKI